jgi:hypothetical protein
MTCGRVTVQVQTTASRVEEQALQKMGKSTAVADGEST